MKIVYFRYKSSILVAWINDGRPFLLLWLRLRLFIVFGKGIWGASCVILRWISFELWNSLECTMPSGWCVFFSFIPFNGMILRESSSLSSPFLFVTSAKDSILRILSSSCGAICFKMFPRWRDQHQLRKTFIHSLFCGAGALDCLFTATELRIFVASFETNGNLETSTFLRWLWICCCVVFVCLCYSVSYGFWADVEEKSPKYSSKWTLKVGNFHWSRSSAWRSS